MSNLIDPPRLLWLAGNVLHVLFIGKDDHVRPFESFNTALDFTCRSFHQNQGASDESIRILAIGQEREIKQILVEVNVRKRFLRCSVNKMKFIPCDDRYNIAVVQRLKTLSSSGDLIDD